MNKNKVLKCIINAPNFLKNTQRKISKLTEISVKKYRTWDKISKFIQDSVEKYRNALRKTS